MTNLANLMNKKLERTKILAINELRIEAMKGKNGSTWNNSKENEVTKNSFYDSKTAAQRLFSASQDRLNKLYNSNEKSLIEQSMINGIKTLSHILSRRILKDKKELWDYLKSETIKSKSNYAEQIFDKDELESFYIQKLENIRDKGRSEEDYFIE